MIREIRMNHTTGIDKNVKFIETWRLDFGLFALCLRVNYILEDGTVVKGTDEGLFGGSLFKRIFLGKHK